MTKMPQHTPAITHMYRKQLYNVVTFSMVVNWVLMTSCLDMPEIKVLEANNRPPLINKARISPETPIVKIDSLCKKEFSFSEVTELDTNDMLYVRWYIDYEYIKNYQKSSVIPASDKKSITRSGDSFTLDIKNSILPHKSRGSIHTVEVILADRPFLQDSTEPPPFKAVEKGGNIDYISWTVIQLEDCF
ncbi:MAG: hypothetical protein N2746_11750 [Deltaproteobacteria bacterium]|nr:hypothetical protein [Deltaproteobacteria bacterium]